MVRKSRRAALHLPRASRLRGAGLQPIRADEEMTGVFREKVTYSMEIEQRLAEARKKGIRS